MNSQVAQNYLRTRVLTATPEQLQLMLYDGALRFGEQAKAALSAKNFETSHNMILKVQKILVELTGSLKHDVSPDLCSKLSALYNYAYRKLIEANMKHDLASLEEGLNVLRFQRDTWALLLDQLGKHKAGLAAQSLDMPAPNSRMEATLSMQG